MSRGNGGKHPYAKAYERAGGKRAERAFQLPTDDAAGNDKPDKADKTPTTDSTDVSGLGTQSDPDRSDDSADDATGNQPPSDNRTPGYGISRAALVLVALALGMGLLIGRVSVNTDTAQVAAPTPTATTPVSIPLGPTSLQQTGAKCSQQRGKNLILGVEVRNLTTAPVILQQLRVSLPKSGLVLADTGVGSCGELNVPNLKDFGLSPQGTVWLSATLRVQTACPAALPVSMTVFASDSTGRVQSINVSGFANLKDVPWSGCATKSTTG